MAKESGLAPVEFGRFAVLPHRRELLDDRRPIELGGRAFDVLMALIEARGTVLGRDELIGGVWPGRVVEESNLQVQSAGNRLLRTALEELGGARFAARYPQFLGALAEGLGLAGAPVPPIVGPQDGFLSLDKTKFPRFVRGGR